MNYIWYYVAIFALMCLAAFFSSAEMAYSSANRIRLENARESGSRRARIACLIYDRYDDTLSAILIGNNLGNIASSSLASVIAILIAGEEYAPIATVIITILVIIFCENIPKITAKRNANQLSLRYAYVIRALTIILKPVIWIVVNLINLITAPMKGDNPDEDGQDAAVEELQSIIETVEDEGVIDEERSELLRSALDFSEISANEVMTARVDMSALDIEDDWDELLEIIENTPYSRLPVYEDSIDNIIGVLYLNHFFKAIVDGGPVDIRSLLMAPCFVYKTVKLPSVLSELRRHKMHMAIVTDEYGGAMGLVTMEDVLEQLVGEIWDETDEVFSDIIDRGDGVFELDGDLSIGEFLELLDWSEDGFNSDSATVGGWTLEMFGNFPKADESFTFRNLTVTVLAMDGLRVENVLIAIESHENGD